MAARSLQPTTVRSRSAFKIAEAAFVVFTVALLSTSVTAQWGGGGLSADTDPSDIHYGEGMQMRGGAMPGPGGLPEGSARFSSGGFDATAEMPPGGAFDGDDGGDQVEDPAVRGFVPTARKGFVPPRGFRTRGGASVEELRNMGGPSLSNMRDPAEREDDGYGIDEEEEGDGDEQKYGGGGSSSGDGERQHLDKCLKQVAQFCSFRVMQENFAMFVDCVAAMKPRIKQSCHEWAEEHRPCVEDVKRLCMRMSPPETTECMLASKPRISNGCVESKWYQAMEEGYGDFKQKMNEAREAGAPGYDGTQDSDYVHDPEGMEGGYGERDGFNRRQQQQQKQQKQRPHARPPRPPAGGWGQQRETDEL